MAQRTALQFRNYRTLPLVFQNVIVDKDMLPYSEVQLEAAYFDPHFEPPRFVNSKECATEVSSSAEVAFQAMHEWVLHYSQLGYYLQFHDDKSGDKLNRFRSHTELVSAILTRRLNINAEPFWDAFDWLVRFKITYERYRADPDRINNYNRHVEALETLNAKEDERDKTTRRIAQAEIEIEARAEHWQNSTPIDKPGASQNNVEIHQHGFSMNIRDSTIQGSNIVGPGASATNLTASNLTTLDDLRAAFEELKRVASETVPNERKEEICDAMDLLIRSTQDSTLLQKDIAAAAEKVASSSPDLADRLRSIGGRVGTSLVASTIFQALKIAFGIH